MGTITNLNNDNIWGPRISIELDIKMSVEKCEEIFPKLRSRWQPFTVLATLSGLYSESKR